MIENLHCNFTEGVKYSSVNHAVLAQQELGRGIKQGVRESVVWFLERIQEKFNLIESEVKGAYTGD